jgi:ABC-2 type transport system ATP-binding protein
MTNSHEHVIQTAGLTKVFRDFWHRQRVVAVDSLDLDVQRNEVFGLLGPNGSGKTTTIKMLLGLLYPTRGRIQVLGRAPTDVAVKSHIGFLPEESYLYRFLNARETLDYYGRLFRIPRQERRRRVEQLLEMTGLTREARRRVGEYSKGMARRIGLAQALINDPDLLILDEPTTGLDPLGTREIKDLILFLNREKRKTILLCSHLLADVEDVCQRVTVLYGGKQRAVGEVQDLLRQQDLTQITAERLSQETIDRIKQLIEQDSGRRLLEVTSPRDRLETFFLRIVREAQNLKQATSGVGAGGQIDDFLSTQNEGDAFVDSLMKAAEREPTPTEKTPEPVEAEPASEVLDELMSSGGASAEQQSEESPSSTDRTSQQSEADAGVIEDLLNRADKKPNQDQE